MPGEVELIRHLQVVTGLEEPLLRKLLEEVHAWYQEDLAGWVRRRHRELHRQGLGNREIYPRLRAESRSVLVRPKPLSERQVRRIVYG